MTDSWLVWSGAMERAKPRIVASDIPVAIAWYKEQVGELPKFIAVHPSNAGLPIPEGIEVEVIGGCLAWELWLASSIPLSVSTPLSQNSPSKPQVVVDYPPAIMSTLKAQKAEVDIIQPMTPILAVTKRGPKQKPLPIELIRQWASGGMGSKAISTQLAKEGKVEVSYKTIQRLLAGQRVMV